MSYEEDLQLPESGSLVQCISVDPHSAVFGPNGHRLDQPQQPQTLEKQGLSPTIVPSDVTGDDLKYGRSNTSFLSSFQTPTHLKNEVNAASSAAAAAYWANGKSQAFLCSTIVV